MLENAPFTPLTVRPGPRSGPVPALLASLVLLALWVVPAPAGATTLLELSTDDLIDLADVVVDGHCTATETRSWKGLTVTAYTFEVSDQLKGGASGQVTVLVPGGVLYDRDPPLIVHVAGAPRLAVDDRALLFLTDAGDGSGYFVTGFSQGLYRVLQAEDGQTLGVQNLTGARLASSKGVTDGALTTVQLEGFKDHIRRRLAGEGGS